MTIKSNFYLKVFSSSILFFSGTLAGRHLHFLAVQGYWASLPASSMFRDDTQLYLSFRADDDNAKDEALRAMEECIRDLRKWLIDGRLLLNEDKTEFLVIVTRQQLHKLGPLSLHIDDHNIDPSSNARNLGAIIDISDQVWTIILTKYVKPVTIIFITSVQFQILSKECLKTLVQAFMTWSLLHGLPKYQICKPQRVQNTAARHISNTRKYDRISPVLSNLHWLLCQCFIVSILKF